jgi:hypothetical protein
VAEIIDAAIRLLRRHARTLFAISGAVLLPLGILQFVVARWGSQVAADAALLTPSSDPQIALEQMFDTLGPFFLVALVSGVVAGLAQLLVQLGSVKAITDIYLEQDPNWRDSLAYGFKRLPAAIGAFLIAIIPLIVGFVLCFLPGVALATLWSLTGVVIAAEGRGSAGALSRSFELVKKRFWPVLGVLVLAVLITVVIGLITGAIIGGVTAATGTIQTDLQTVLNILIGIVTTPFTVAVLTVAYFDLRVRLEGLDVELLARRSDQQGPSVGSGPSAPPDDSDPFGLGRPGGP